MLVFPLAELPELARGKGNKLIGIPSARAAAREEFVAGLCVVIEGDTLQVTSGGHYRNFKWSELEHFRGERGRRRATRSNLWVRNKHPAKGKGIKYWQTSVQKFAYFPVNFEKLVQRNERIVISGNCLQFRNFPKFRQNSVKFSPKILRFPSFFYAARIRKSQRKHEKTRTPKTDCHFARHQSV